MRSIPASTALEMPALITIVRGATTLRWNTSSSDVTIGGDIWVAAAGATISSFSYGSDGTENDGDVTIQTATGGLVEPGDGLRGILDNWPISVKLFDPADPAGTASEIMPGSIVGSVAEDTNGLATIKVSGQLVKAGVYVTEHFSLTGREDMFDTRSGVDSASYTNATTGQATGTYVVTLDSLPDARASDPTWYVNGRLYVLSGNLNGYPALPIRAWDPGTLEVTLFLPVLEADIPAATTLQIQAGWDGTPDQRFSRFGDIINMRAEYFVPPPDMNF